MVKKSSKRIIIKIKDTNSTRNYLYSYVETTRRMLSLISRGLKRKNNNYLDLVFPTLFILRHSLELALKILIKRIDPQYKFPKDANKAHDLNFLINEIERMEPHLVTDYPLIKNFANDIGFVDKNGTFFKYTNDLNGNKTIVNVEVQFTDLINTYNKFFKMYRKMIDTNYPDLWNMNKNLNGF